MVELTRLNGTSFVVNSDLIETIEQTPDTVVTLTVGTKYVVKEDKQQVIDKVVAFRRRIMQP